MESAIKDVLKHYAARAEKERADIEGGKELNVDDLLLWVGPESGAQMVFIALAATPFALFDLADRIPLAAGVALSVGCFALVQSGWLSPWRDPNAAFIAAGYQPYSAVVTLLVLVFSLYQTSAANAKAEQQLRHDISERLRTERSRARPRSTPPRWRRWAR